jgi:hypothetical protein
LPAFDLTPGSTPRRTPDAANGASTLPAEAHAHALDLLNVLGEIEEGDEAGRAAADYNHDVPVMAMAAAVEPPETTRHIRFSKVLDIVTLFSKYTMALTFQNLCQAHAPCSCVSPLARGKGLCFAGCGGAGGFGGGPGQ